MVAKRTQQQLHVQQTREGQEQQRRQQEPQFWCGPCNGLRTAVQVDAGGGTAICAQCEHEIDVARLQEDVWTSECSSHGGGGGDRHRAADVGAVALMREAADALGVASESVLASAQALFAAGPKKDKPHVAAALYLALEQCGMGRPQVQVAHFFNLGGEPRAVADAIRGVRLATSRAVVCVATPHEVFQAVKDRIGHNHPSVQCTSFATLREISRAVRQLLGNEEMALRPPQQLADEVIRRVRLAPKPTSAPPRAC